MSHRIRPGEELRRKSVNAFYSQPPERPFCGSCAIVNRYLNETFEELGYQVRGVYGTAPQGQADFFLPLPAVDRARRARNLPPADIALYCDFGLQLAPLRRRGSQKNVVFFHGFAGSPGHWAGNELVDRCWGASPYTRDVVRSLLAVPDWRARRLLDPRAFGIVSHINIPLPCLEEPDGALPEGLSELPWNVREALYQGDILGHAVVAVKVNVPAMSSILLLLNRLARERALGRRFRLVVANEMFHRIQAALRLPPDQSSPDLESFRTSLDQLDMTAADLLIPVPALAQSVLFEILTKCRFGLFYNVFAEPFGFYPLESVFHGCPVYTNGIGNLRYLLPDGCGIHVYEDEGTAQGDPAAFLPVAEAIYHDAVEDPGGARERCRLGVEHIRKEYSREALRREVAAELERLASRPEEHDFDTLGVCLSPLVRQWNPVTARVVSDYSGRVLNGIERSLVDASLGRTCGELRGSFSGTDVEVLEKLFLSGVLALAPPPSPIASSLMVA